MISSTSKNSEPQLQQFLQITHHDKFYSRLLSKESSIANPSFRVYYGGASGTVPFVWESQPGTPKRTAIANPLPPLAPPPSYHSNQHPKSKKKASKYPPKSNLIQYILPRTKKSPIISTTTTSTTTQSASSSVSLSSTSTSSSRSSGGSHRSSFSSRAEDEDSADRGSPTSTLRGCYSMLTMKNVLLSIVGGSHGSAQPWRFGLNSS